MSEIDTMNGYATTAAGTPDANSPSSGFKIWDIPARAPTARSFTIQVDQNSGYWTIYDGGIYAVESGQGSVLLQHAMRRKGITQ